jgi:hypothetical protein
MDNRLMIFTPRILPVHDENGQLRLSHDEVIVYDEAKRRIGDRANEAFGYRGLARASQVNRYKLPRARACLATLNPPAARAAGRDRL